MKKKLQKNGQNWLKIVEQKVTKLCSEKIKKMTKLCSKKSKVAPFLGSPNSPWGGKKC